MGSIFNRNPISQDQGEGTTLFQFPINLKSVEFLVEFRRRIVGFSFELPPMAPLISIGAKALPRDDFEVYAPLIACPAKSL